MKSTTMKKLMLMFLLGTVTMSCKKEKEESQFAPLEVVVSDLTAKTSLTIVIRDQDRRKVLDIENRFGNTTYTTDYVKTGDVLNVTYKSNIASDLENNGNGTLTFKFKGKIIGVAAGNLNYPKTGTTTVHIH